MTATETKARHPALEPRELGPHEALDGDILYYIGFYPPMPTGSIVVRAERPDGSNWLAIEDEIPQKLKDELERRLHEHRPSRRPNAALQWGMQAEKNAVYLRLQEKDSSLHALYRCQELMHDLVERGQRTLTVRVVIEEGEQGPPDTAEVTTLKRFLSETGMRLEVSSPVTSPSGPDLPDPRITYVPWAISL